MTSAAYYGYDVVGLEVGFGIDLGPIHLSTDHGVSVEDPGKWASHVVHDVSKGVSDFVKNPIAVTSNVLSAAGKFASDALHTATGVLSLIPGIGTGLSSAIEAGLAVLDGGSPLDIAIHAAYGAIPIPPGLKTITDHVLSVVLALADKLMAGAPLDDAAIAAVTSQLPSSPPFIKDVADSLLHLVVQAMTKHPTRKTFQQAAAHPVVKAMPKPPPRPLPKPLPVRAPPKPLPIARPPVRVAPKPLPLHPSVAPMAPVPHAAVPAAALPRMPVVRPGSPGAPPGATHWTCFPGAGGTWQCRWV